MNKQSLLLPKYIYIYTLGVFISSVFILLSWNTICINRREESSGMEWVKLMKLHNANGSRVGERRSEIGRIWMIHILTSAVWRSATQKAKWAWLDYLVSHQVLHTHKYYFLWVLERPSWVEFFFNQILEIRHGSSSVGQLYLLNEEILKGEDSLLNPTLHHRSSIVVPSCVRIS